MTDRPIIFSAPMVRALLAGRKTQTRRIIKTPPAPHHLGAWEVSTIGGSGVTDIRGRPVPEQTCLWHSRNGVIVMPRYAVGDRLYVREHWRVSSAQDNVPPRELSKDLTVEFVADRGGYFDGKHRQGMHMPRWASRLTLILELVKIEPLQSISRDDAIAEGLEAFPQTFGASAWGVDTLPETAHRLDPAKAFAELWRSLHAKEGETWEDNPFVVALQFRVERGNIDRLAG
ncbi:hypothetical protein [Sphingomonas sp. MMS24-J13]|uniref:hypothetical protein n=1 Tax=Sphingomonas sp. MMS24-J13 TaxID=3238686 RepID=UPI003851246D